MPFQFPGSDLPTRFGKNKADPLMVDADIVGI